MASEKRRHPRFAVQVPVVVEINGERIAARTRDLSLGGMFVETDRRFAFDVTLVAELVLPSLDEPARIPGTVRWSIAEGMGVAFGTIRPAEARAIHQLEDRARGK